MYRYDYVESCQEGRILSNAARLVPLAAMVCVLVSACNDKPLFEAPPRGGNAAVALPPTESVVTLVASLPYAALIKAAEKKIPPSFPIGGDGDVGCTDIPHLNAGHIGSHQECIDKPYVDFRGVGMERICGNVPDLTAPSIGMARQCAGYSWNADVAMDGPVRISRSGADVRVEQGIHVSGKAGLRGDLAKILSLSGKNFDVRAAAALDTGVGLDTRWCPIVRAVPVGHWVNSASAEVVGKNCVGFDFGPLGHPQACAGPVNLGLSNVLNDEFDKHRGDIQKAAQEALPCDAVRNAIAAQWRPLSIAVERPGRPSLFLNIEPKNAGASDLIAGDEALRLVAQVTATTTLTTAAVPSTNTPLPPLEKAAAQEGSLDVNLQAVAPYTFLSGELAAALKGKKFDASVGSGTVEVGIVDVDVYPSNGSLVIGMKVNAKTPGRWFDTVGWVYVLGKPTSSKGGKAVSVEDLHFATVLDNEFWTSVEALFQTQILAALRAHATFDLSSQIDAAAVQITAGIAKAHVEGLTIKAGPPVIRLTGIAVASDDLVVEAKLAMRLDLELSDGLLK